MYYVLGNLELKVNPPAGIFCMIRLYMFHVYKANRMQILYEYVIVLS